MGVQTTLSGAHRDIRQCPPTSHFGQQVRIIVAGANRATQTQLLRVGERTGPRPRTEERATSPHRPWTTDPTIPKGRTPSPFRSRAVEPITDMLPRGCWNCGAATVTQRARGPDAEISASDAGSKGIRCARAPVVDPPTTRTPRHRERGNPKGQSRRSGTIAVGMRAPRLTPRVRS